MALAAVHSARTHVCPAKGPITSRWESRRGDGFEARRQVTATGEAAQDCPTNQRRGHAHIVTADTLQSLGMAADAASTRRSKPDLEPDVGGGSRRPDPHAPPEGIPKGVGERSHTVEAGQRLPQEQELGLGRRFARDDMEPQLPPLERRLDGRDSVHYPNGPSPRWRQMQA